MYVLMNITKKSKLGAFVYFANFLTEMTSISPKEKKVSYTNLYTLVERILYNKLF